MFSGVIEFLISSIVGVAKQKGGRIFFINSEISEFAIIAPHLTPARAYALERVLNIIRSYVFI